MNSSISHFNWVSAVVAGFIAVEASIAFWAPRPDAIRNNLLELAFAKPELVQRAFVAEKVQQFDNLKPDIIQVGDSSGLHAAQAPIVESYLEGRSFLNLSVASNLGYGGYLAVAQRMMERSGSVKALVLYFTTSPRPALISARDLMAADLQRELVSPFHKLFHTPSLGLRREVSDYIYYLNGTFNQPDRPLIANDGYLMLRDIMAASGGWIRETDLPNDNIDGLFKMIRQNDIYTKNFDDATFVRNYRDIGASVNPSIFEWKKFKYRTYLGIVFDDYLALARKHGARLVIVTNPVPDAFRPGPHNGGSEARNAFDWPAVSQGLRDYGRSNQDVSILDFDFWPDRKFSVFSHVGTPYSTESSHRVGRFLNGIVKDLPPADPKQPRYRAPDRVVLEMGASPTIYGFAAVEKSGLTSFRRIREGRHEALAYARVNPNAPQELRISVLNGLEERVLRDLSIGVFGETAIRLPDLKENDRRYVRFALPTEATSRFDGWLELTLSTRGATAWLTDALDASANGPELKIERIEIGSISVDAAGLSNSAFSNRTLGTEPR